MMMIKLIVSTNPTNTAVMITAETEVAGDSENRSYTLQPAHAVSVANAILHAAELCGVEVQVQTSHPITTMQRLQLIHRTGHIMRTLAKQKPEKICTHIVDSILAEIL